MDAQLKLQLPITDYRLPITRHSHLPRTSPAYFLLNLSFFTHKSCGRRETEIVELNLSVNRQKPLIQQQKEVKAMNANTRVPTNAFNNLPALTNDLPTLAQPMYGSLAVAILQPLLILQGYGENLPVTGNFLNETTAAVINFQQAQGLQQDGIVGPNTWTALAFG